MSADPVKNFCKVEVSGYYGTSETSITLKAGEGSKLPPPLCNLVWWNATDYQDPTDDPYREIVRVTAVNGDVLTVLRGQEDTIAQPHNIPGKVYKMMRVLTAKDYEDLQKIDVYKDGSLVGSRPKINFRGVEVSDDSLNNKVDITVGGFFTTRATSPPSLQLYVSRGQVIIGGVYVFFSGGNSPSFTIPSTNPRIDLLCLNSSGALEIVQGTESATPTAPIYPNDKFVICEVYNRPNQTCIKDSDDGTNGYIYRDVRAGTLKIEEGPITASDTIQWSNDDIRRSISNSWVKLKEIKLNEDLPAVRIYFELSSDAYITVYAAIYKNDSQIGTTRSVTGTTWTGFDEDFTGFKKNDLIQIYGHGSPNYVEVRNMRLKFSHPITKIEGLKLTTPIHIGFENEPTNQDP